VGAALGTPSGKEGAMDWIRWSTGLGTALVLLSGCSSGPLVDNPLAIGQPPTIAIENPVYVPLGPQSYGVVFERVIDVLDEYFEISYANRYDGTIRTFPRIAPGFEQFWKPGSPDFDQRLLATLQTIRHRAEVLIQPADDGGFFVQVTVYRELEDLPRPVRSTAGAASFRSDNTVERQFEVIDPTVFESNWIPVGRDTCLEQELLRRIKECM
jgi:hypothetical protein